MTWIRAREPAWSGGTWRRALAGLRVRHQGGARVRRAVTALARVSRSLTHPRAVLCVEKLAGGGLLIVSEDGEGRRYLQSEWGGTLQSMARPGFPLRLELHYTRAMAAGLAFVAEPRRLLVVGVGGGALPMFLHALLPQADIDAVDLHPEVLDVARRYFGFREDAGLHAHVADGRRFIESAGPPYDVIFLDAYSPRGIPRTLVSCEFLHAARARLAPGGALVSNVWRSPNPLFPSVVRTWQESFPQLHAFDVRETANRVLIGLADTERRSRGTLKARAAQLTRGRGVPFSLIPLVARRCRGPEAGYGTHPEASVLRDPPG